MDNLSQRFRTFVAREGLFRKDDKLLLAISGGIDSCALAHLLSTEGYEFGMIHCNYQLRGEDSDKDADLVHELAGRYSCPLHEEIIPPPYPLPDNFNLQLWAREKRYTYFEKILDEYNYHYLVTAHHLDDNLETHLINLIRGSGLAGLRGIPVETDFPAVRPLLEASRTDIESYARAAGLTWREDLSNASDDYLRNRLRHGVIPLLRQAGAQDKNLRSTFDHLRSAEYFYETGIVNHPVVRHTPESIVFDRKKGAGLRLREWRTLLWYHCKDSGFTAEQYRQMLSKGGSYEILSSTHTAQVEPDRISVTPNTTLNFNSTTIRELPVKVSFGPRHIYLDIVEQPAKLYAEGIQFCRIPALPLLLRPRAPGDRFAPYGLQGKTKKVKDLLIDLKLSPWEKKRTPILIDPENRIIAVVGHRVSEGYSVRPEDRHVLRIRFETGSPELPE